MNDETRSNSMDEADVAALLLAAGARPAPSGEAMAAVRAAVEAEWRAAVAARRRRPRYTAWAAAAGVAVAAVSVWLARPALEPAHVTVASVTRVVGDVQQNRGDDRWTPLAAADSIESGAQLRTSSGARAALSLPSGVELRLDGGTLVALDDAKRATLSQGAVYVDSGGAQDGASAAFVLDTPAGSVQHLGTQYEARFQNGDLRVGVREGRVRVSGAHGEAVGDAGERLTVAGGRVERSRLAPTATDWDWVANVTPPFSIEGRSVEAFLIWAARETGRTIVYASPDAARQARTVTLSGSVEGLTPEAAVTAVLSTTSLRPEIGEEHIRVRAGQP